MLFIPSLRLQSKIKLLIEEQWLDCLLCLPIPQTRTGNDWTPTNSVGSQFARSPHRELIVQLFHCVLHSTIGICTCAFSHSLTDFYCPVILVAWLISLTGNCLNRLGHSQVTEISHPKMLHVSKTLLFSIHLNNFQWPTFMADGHQSLWKANFGGNPMLGTHQRDGVISSHLVGTGYVHCQICSIANKEPGCLRKTGGLCRRPAWLISVAAPK